MNLPEMLQSLQSLPIFGVMIKDVVESKKMRIGIVLFVLSIMLGLYCYRTHFSDTKKNEKFVNDFRSNLIANDLSNPLAVVMDIKSIEFDSRELIAEFITNLMDTTSKMSNKYNDIKIYHVVVNEKPSRVFQLNGNQANDNKIKEQHGYLGVDANKTYKEYGFKMLSKRKNDFDKAQNIKHVSIFWEDNDVNFETFKQNINNSGGLYMNQSDVQNIDIFKESKGKINGLYLTNVNLIDKIKTKRLNGQFFVIKKATGQIMLFIEKNGQQSNNNINNDISRSIKYLGTYNKKDIKIFDESLYSLLNLIGVIDLI